MQYAQVPMQNQTDKSLRYKEATQRDDAWYSRDQSYMAALTSAHLMLLLINSGKILRSSWLYSDMHYLLVHNLTSFWTSLNITCNYLVYGAVFLWDAQHLIFLPTPHSFTAGSNPSSMVTTWVPVSGSECPLHEIWTWLTWALLWSVPQGDTS